MALERNGYRVPRRELSADYPRGPDFTLKRQRRSLGPRKQATIDSSGRRGRKVIRCRPVLACQFATPAGPVNPAFRACHVNRRNTARNPLDVSIPVRDHIGSRIRSRVLSNEHNEVEEANEDWLDAVPSRSAGCRVLQRFGGNMRPTGPDRSENALLERWIIKLLGSSILESPMTR